MEIWIIFALLSSILFAVVSVLDKYAVYDRSGISPYLLNMFVGYSNLIVSLFFLAIYFRSFNIYHFYALSVGAIQGVSLIALFWTLKKLSVTRTMTMWSSYPFWVALISLIFLVEYISVKYSINFVFPFFYFQVNFEPTTYEQTMIVLRLQIVRAAAFMTMAYFIFKYLRNRRPLSSVVPVLVFTNFLITGGGAVLSLFCL